MNRMARHTAIPAEVKAAVSLRDSIDGQCCCILCGSPEAAPNAHIIRRSQGGMGVEQNIVTLCGPCHYAFDEGLNIKRLWPLGLYTRADIRRYIINYIKGFYSDWTPESVTYRKWRI